MKSKMAQINKFLLVFFSLLCFLGSISSITQVNFADSSKDKQKIVDEANSFDGGNENGFFEKTNGLKGKFTREDTISNIYKYMFMKGNYIQEVTNGVLGSKDEGVDDSVVQKRGDTKTVCYFNEQPQNALNHNCDIPTFSSQLGQVTYALLNSQGVLGAEVTSAKTELGMPAGIPGGSVPVFGNERIYKYTALELFGYNLHYTTYVGEWDNIVPQTQARLMSNFGFWSKAKLGATSVFNGVKGAINAAVTKFDWNPIKYVANIIDGGSSSILWTIIDTSDLNIVSTHAWSRPDYSATVYNAYYMSSKEVHQKGQAWLLAKFEEEFSKLSSPNPDVQKMLDLSIRSSKFPKYQYKRNVETEESKNARKNADKTKTLVPDRIYETEADQFKRWKSENSAFLDSAKSAGIDCLDRELYTDFITCYDEAWNKYASKVVQENKDDVDKAFSAITENYIKKDPHFDPSRSIAHYVCADENGDPVGQSMAEWSYAFTDENSKNGESLGNCGELRPSIKGALYGNGEGDFSDTRYKHFITKGKAAKSNGSLGFVGSVSNFVAVIAAKITNSMLTLSFSNILKELGISSIIAKTIEIFRDSIFYPLSTIGIAISAFWILISCFKMGFGRQTFSLLFLLVITFGVGVALLYKPEQTTQLVEEIPSKIDNFLINVITTEEDKKASVLCSATGGDTTGVRKMQCQVWKMSIFDPWVYGQWGTSYENLDASKFSNTNQKLVGDAPINMGGGSIHHNWALYQLDITKSGSITDTNPKETDNTINRNIYRIVDLQAGPNDGAKSDSTYLTAWSGSGLNRDSYQLRGAIVSVCIAFLIGGLAIVKIEYTLMIAIQVFILPIQLALGLFPGGNVRIKNYFENLLSLFFKRFLIVLVMSLALLMLSKIDSASDNYNSVFFGIVIIAVAIKMYWKELVNLFASTTNNAGSFMSGGIREHLNMRNMPKFLQRRIPKYTTGVKDTIAGGVGGAIAGISAKIADESKGISKGNLLSYMTEGTKKGSAYGNRRFNMMNETRQRKMGYGAYDTLGQIREAVAQKQKDSFNNENTVVSNNWKNMEAVLRNEIVEHEAKKKNEEHQIAIKTKQLESLKNRKELNYNEEARMYQLESEIEQHKLNREDLEFRDTNIENASKLLDKAKESNYKFDNNKVNGNFLAMQPGQREIRIDENGRKHSEILTTEEAVERFIDTATTNMRLIEDDEKKALQKSLAKEVKDKAVETVNSVKDKFSNNLDDFKDKTGLNFNDEIIYEEAFWTKPYTETEEGKRTYGQSEADKYISEFDKSAPELATALRELAVLAKQSSNGLIKEKKKDKSSYKKSKRQTIKERLKKTKEENPNSNLKDVVKGTFDKGRSKVKKDSEFDDMSGKEFENPFEE